MRIHFYSSVLLSAVSLAAATGPQEGAAVFNAEARMVLVPTTVMDRHGAIVSGLRPDSFAISQDSLPQRIVSFGEQDMPVSIGVVFDCSGSMRQVLPAAKTVLRTFFEAANPEDEAFLFTVSSSRLRSAPGQTGVEL